MKPRKQLNARLPRELVRQFKREVADRELTQEALMEEILTEYFEQKRQRDREPSHATA